MTKVGCITLNTTVGKKVKLKEPIFSEEAESLTTVCSGKGVAYRIL